MNGTASASPTIPRESGYLGRAYTCHATTVAWICVPSVTATRLATYQRKLGLRSDTYGSCCSAIPSGTRFRKPDDKQARHTGQSSGGALCQSAFYFSPYIRIREESSGSGCDHQAGKERVSSLLREVHRSRGKRGLYYTTLKDD